MEQYKLAVHFTQAQREWVKKEARLYNLPEGSIVRKAVEEAMSRDAARLRSAVESNRQG